MHARKAPLGLFFSSLSTKQRKFGKLITARCKGKPNTTRISFNAQLKIALITTFTKNVKTNIKLVNNSVLQTFYELYSLHCNKCLQEKPHSLITKSSMPFILAIHELFCLSKHQLHKQHTASTYMSRILGYIDLGTR